MLLTIIRRGWTKYRWVGELFAQAFGLENNWSRDELRELKICLIIQLPRFFVKIIYDNHSLTASGKELLINEKELKEKIYPTIKQIFRYQ